jgi:hypothetical protein
MKRYLIPAAILAGLVIFLLCWRGGNIRQPDAFDRTPQAVALANSSNPAAAIDPSAKHAVEARSNSVAKSQEQYLEERKQAMQHFNESQNVPVAFYGLIVDQDSNALQNVTVDLNVTEEYVDASYRVTGSTTNVQRQTGADGRFELTGPKARIVRIQRLAKEGYEPEMILRHYGEYGPQSTSYENPAVFRLWSTNVHEPLITGERKFQIIPDGRHYVIDLIKGTIGEGNEGDMVISIKRPESVTPPEKYTWSCGMAASGGLEPENDLNSAMYRAPVGGYTNVFNFHVAYNTPAGRGMSFDNRFYFKVRDGKMYGRLTADFWTTDRSDPAFGLIRIVYAVNPSGSRLLR